MQWSPHCRHMNSSLDPVIIWKSNSYFAFKSNFVSRKRLFAFIIAAGCWLLFCLRWSRHRRQFPKNLANTVWPHDHVTLLQHTRITERSGHLRSPPVPLHQKRSEVTRSSTCMRTSQCCWTSARSPPRTLFTHITHASKRRHYSHHFISSLVLIWSNR